MLQQVRRTWRRRQQHRQLYDYTLDFFCRRELGVSGVHYKVVAEVSKGLVALAVMYMGLIGQIPAILSVAAAVSIVAGGEIIEKFVVRLLVERFITESRKHPESDSGEADRIAKNLSDKLEELNDD